MLLLLLLLLTDHSPLRDSVLDCFLAAAVPEKLALRAAH
jgi:hypothetical protein